MKTQAQKYFSLVLPSLAVLLTLLLMASLLFLVFNSYDSVIQLLLRYSHFPESKLQDLKTEYLSIQRFELLRYVLFALVCLSVALCYLLYKRKNTLYFTIETFVGQCFNRVILLIQAIKGASVYGRIIITLCFLFISGFLVWGAASNPLIYDEVFSYLYFVNKGFLVTASYYPGPNNHVFYLLCCNVIDVFCNSPVWIMRLPALIAGISTCAILLLYFNKRFSAIFAVLFTLLFYTSYSIFYYSFHGRGYAFIFLFFVISLLSVYESISKRSSLYIYVFVISSILGCYSVPIFVYPLGSFAVFFFVYAFAKKEYAFLITIVKAYLFIGIALVILYSPILLVSGWNALMNNDWVRPLDFLSYSKVYGEFVIAIQNHFWEVSGGGWILTLTTVLLGGLALYQSKKNWWFVLFMVVLVCPFLFIFIQRVFPFERVLNYLFLVLAFMLSAFIIYILQLIKGRGKVIVASLVLIGIAVLGTAKIRKETTIQNRYFDELDRVMKAIAASNVEKVYSSDDTYALYIKYHSLLSNRHLEVLSAPVLEENEIVILSGNDKINDLEGFSAEPIMQNQSVKVLKIIKNNCRHGEPKK